MVRSLPPLSPHFRDPYLRTVFARAEIEIPVPPMHPLGFSPVAYACRQLGAAASKCSAMMRNYQPVFPEKESGMTTAGSPRLNEPFRYRDEAHAREVRYGERFTPLGHDAIAKYSRTLKDKPRTLRSLLRQLFRWQAARLGL